MDTKTHNLNDIKSLINKDDAYIFFSLYRRIEKIARNILDKYSKAGLLRSDIYIPVFEKIDFDESNEKVLVIKYYDDGYDCYDCDYIKVPFDIILNNTIDEHIERLKYQVQKRKEEYEKAEADRIHKNELAEYERLKNKFEK